MRATRRVTNQRRAEQLDDPGRLPGAAVNVDHLETGPGRGLSGGWYGRLVN